MTDHRVKKEEDLEAFLEKIKNIPKKNIHCSNHASYRLNDQQHNLNCEYLKELIKQETPLRVGIQNNQLHAAFYPYKKGKALRMIIDIKPYKATIVTVYQVKKEDIPKL